MRGNLPASAVCSGRKDRKYDARRTEPQHGAAGSTIDEYIKSKVNKNLDKIMNAKYLKRLMEYDEIIINGRSFHNLPYYLQYLSEEHLYDIFKNDIL